MAVAQIQNLFFPTLFPSKKDEKASGLSTYRKLSYAGISGGLSTYRKLSYAGISVGKTKFQTQALYLERTNQ